MSSNELMYMNWQQIIKPEKVQVTSTDSYGKFVCEPLERGFGTTIGNCLRRIILSSLYGAAITSVKFENVMHEYSTIASVHEDVSEIILNLKGIRFKVSDAEIKTIGIHVSEPRAITASDITFGSGDISVLNPDHHIATLTGQGSFSAQMTVKVGKGYSLSELNKEEDAPVGTIPIDAVFSPIKRVNYVVRNARVGQRTDYDKLIIEVWTDGSVVPEDAIAYAAKVMKEQMSIFINFDESFEPKVDSESDLQNRPVFNENLYRSVEELELSVRSANCLKNADILKIHQLVTKSESEMLKTKNFGRKSLNEIKQVLSDMGLSLGMKLEGFIPPVEEVDEGEL